MEDKILCINLGSITFGQSKDLVIPMTEDQYRSMKIVLHYDSPHGQKKKQCTSIERINENVTLLKHHKYRLELVYAVRKSLEVLHAPNSVFAQSQQEVLRNISLLEEEIKKNSGGDAYLTDLLSDLTGQINAAFSREDWFKKWGVHYLPSITRM